ncbi:bifunctional 2-polyprenyl-6-hydroxyphenol methylase/3-demethylubiquinol 3-O-methyltransferase UbiG [Ferrovibrio sp.]|uniref:bifunctional 2-polyprenyl-6-hydroxyphenol methylase/3-demethylubiquinol 3-O-methyltransferase UbiG n=1 Tax=Ferrovibrio sp. TaxID=1917215 RepID=UPI0025BD0C21|nr:bifunctional 2-polyprenyl-6-hydroxyphenol methylase/3-demethylubiquinol 3-O-methyltransferase UbiG [Ferrovibrio sp.]MBX3455726.1 bifunctional 2-polyprenyl-6-hydroxyphenol methylase/3-demethylubiquinol 3-O-methyltransferase UbiG [Ferrovibrio sp.]
MSIQSESLANHPENTGLPQGNSVDPAEIARFSAMAADWWNPRGKFAPLHRFNPVRLGYIREALQSHFGLAAEAGLNGLRLLDIGCGGGLVSEPLARMGARVTGADAGARNIAVASLHAGQSGLDIDYRCTSAEALAESGETFDAVLALEIVEHVADPAGFFAACSRLLRPGGLLIASTLNRSPKAYALAIVGAEYILRWLPPGTHDWKKFLKPHELAKLLRDAGLIVNDVRGANYNPISERWSLGRDTGVNYFMTASKPG